MVWAEVGNAAGGSQPGQELPLSSFKETQHCWDELNCATASEHVLVLQHHAPSTAVFRKTQKTDAERWRMAELG